MWEGLIQKAKDGGVDVIETYVFWNLHEPSPGKVSSVPNFYIMFCLFVCLTISSSSSVWFWWEKWFGEIREDSTQSWFICSSSHWALCLCRVEFWVSKLLSCLFRFNCLNSKVVVFLAMSRGFPVWLKYVPGISFRTDNEPFKVSFELLYSLEV